MDALQVPGLYGEETDQVELVETHISYLFLTNRFVYKLKKPLQFDFLDYSTLEQRRCACEAELLLNRRLAADVYLDVVAIGRDDQGNWRIANDQNVNLKVDDWLVRMRRLPAERCLTAMIDAKTCSDSHVSDIIRLLSDFYRSCLPVRAAEYCAQSFRRIVDNREELLSPEHALPSERVQRVTAAQLQFLFINDDLFQRRVDERHIVEGHGDLRAEHIYMTQRPVVIDCIEFSAELRTLDTADELCFFAMTCDKRGAEYVGARVLREVCDALGDRPGEKLLNFYRSYRACVRAKVAALRAKQTAALAAPSMQDEAASYLDLALEYAKGLGSPFALVVRGLSGSGKSTLASVLARHTGATHLSTDELRKQSSGPQASHATDYSEASRQGVYDTMVHRAISQIAIGKSVILDGTFQKADLLSRTISRLCEESGNVQVVTCICPHEVALRRIRERRQTETTSDADERVYAQQVKQSEPVPQNIAAAEVETTQDESKLLAQLRKILQPD